MKRRYTLSFDTAIGGPVYGAEHVEISGEFDESLSDDEIIQKLLLSKQIDPHRNFPKIKLNVDPGYVETHK